MVMSSMQVYWCVWVKRSMQINGREVKVFWGCGLKVERKRERSEFGKRRKRLGLNRWVQVQYLEGLHSLTEAASHHHANTGVTDMMWSRKINRMGRRRFCVGKSQEGRWIQTARLLPIDHRKDSDSDSIFFYLIPSPIQLRNTRNQGKGNGRIHSRNVGISMLVVVSGWSSSILQV